MTGKSNLFEKFTTISLNKEYKTEYDAAILLSNFLRQRRIFVTPTLIRFSIGQEEETNRVIRKFRDHLTNFVRVSFVNEDLDKGYYFAEVGTHLLGYIHSIVGDGFKIGELEFKFLGYSNSQLKNHSCWFLCQNNPHLPISEKDII